LITLHQRKYIPIILKPVAECKRENDSDWEQRKFGDVGSVSMCKRIFKNETSDVGDIPFYKIGTFGGEPDAYISRELFDEYREKFSYPDAGDVLLSASGTIGRIVEFKGEEAYFQDSNIVWLSHDKSISNKFLKVLYPTVKWDGIEGSTIKRLYNDNFLKTQFMMPKVEEQERIGEYFEQLDNLITLHQRKPFYPKKRRKFHVKRDKRKRFIL
ncbi:restriction endonuclease subunit S, partial [Methanobrevibacter sp.]|uniref:restriction endonuclease subunit S n=1 Tax=Methanobrevibacter sp. TaxID=66852 RepID=UPI00386884FD